MKKSLLVLSMLLTSALVISGCTALDWFVGGIKEEFVGRNVIIQTYDEESNIIDRVQGKSVSINPDTRFAITDSEGSTTEKSSVLEITVGGNQMLHVGSTLIAHDPSLENLFEVYDQQVDISNLDRSVPFINRLVNHLKNYTTGKSKVILIRSQSGKPLATFAGTEVSTFATDMDKATGLLIDGKYMLIYRADYTIYDTKLLLEN